MAFMQPEYDPGPFLAIEHHHGETTYVPADVVGVPADADAETLADACASFIAGDVESVERRDGVGVRLQAPGYMDATDWDVCDTYAAARAHVRETWEACPDTGDTLPCGDAPDKADADTLRAHVEACAECQEANACDCGECFTDPPPPEPSRPASVPDSVDAYRDHNGRLVARAYPFGPPMLYLCADGGTLCPACANGGNGSRATAPDLDPECPDDTQWRIVAPLVHEEGPAVTCDHCGAVTESHYGDPDRPEGGA